MFRYRINVQKRKKKTQNYGGADNEAKKQRMTTNEK